MTTICPYWTLLCQVRNIINLKVVMGWSLGGVGNTILGSICNALWKHKNPRNWAFQLLGLTRSVAATRSNTYSTGIHKKLLIPTILQLHYDMALYKEPLSHCWFKTRLVTQMVKITKQDKAFFVILSCKYDLCEGLQKKSSKTK